MTCHLAAHQRQPPPAARDRLRVANLRASHAHVGAFDHFVQRCYEVSGRLLFEETLQLPSLFVHVLLNRGQPSREHWTQNAIDDLANQRGRHTETQRGGEAGSSLCRLSGGASMKTVSRS
jgi:hypothetical protein